MRPHRDRRLERLTGPQACVLSTLHSTNGRIGVEHWRYQIIVDDRSGFRLISACHSLTVKSLLRRRLLDWSRGRNGYTLSALGRRALARGDGA